MKWRRLSAQFGGLAGLPWLSASSAMAPSVVLVVLGKLGHLDLTQALLMAGGAAAVGEIGLWVGAGCLGLTIFKRRKALFDRLFHRRAAASPEV